MNLTDEQTNILRYVLENEDLVKISAVAGSGKTTMLTAIATSLSEQLKPFKGLYLAYNKAIATEASHKFPKSVKCCTTHSLAFSPVLKNYKLNVQTFTYRDIKEKIKYEQKCEVISTIENYCLSKHLTLKDYFDSKRDLSDILFALCTKYLGLMEKGSVPSGHMLYLKIFHILLAMGQITIPTYDIIMLDEAGDLNEVTLEIFKLLPAKRKVMVGDPHQNIYVFNKTINGFAALADQGKLFAMTQSFRVDAKIANRIQIFCRHYMDKDMLFKGTKLADTAIVTKAYITRTNTGLLDKVIQLTESNTAFSLTRPAKAIFGLPIALCSLKEKSFINVAEYSFLQTDVDYYYKHRTQLEHRFTSALSYIINIHSDDQAIKQAANVAMRYGPVRLFKAFEEAKKHEKITSTYTLGTSHSMKGLEFDAVEIADDLNVAIDKAETSPMANVKAEDLPMDVLAEYNLYYVACSRAKKQLTNAKHLDRLLAAKFDTDEDDDTFDGFPLFDTYEEYQCN